MRKKLLIIELQPGIIEGDKIEKDLGDIREAPLGAPANDPFYATLAQQISMMGYTHIHKVDEKQYTHIAPAQIKTVTIKFEN